MQFSSWLGGSSHNDMYFIRLEFQENYLAWTNPGIGRYLIFLAWEGVAFFAIVLLIEYRVHHACARFLAHFFKPSVGGISVDCSLGDDDVLVEKERVMISEDTDDVLVIKELTKKYAGESRKFLLLI